METKGTHNLFYYVPTVYHLINSVTFTGQWQSIIKEVFKKLKNVIRIQGNDSLLII